MVANEDRVVIAFDDGGNNVVGKKAYWTWQEVEKLNEIEKELILIKVYRRDPNDTEPKVLIFEGHDCFALRMVGDDLMVTHCDESQTNTKDWCLAPDNNGITPKTREWGSKLDQMASGVMFITKSNISTQQRDAALLLTPDNV